MNIFFLDECPIQSARQHCDKHIVKMIVEYAQMLSTTHRIIDDYHHPLLYKKAFVNHPMTIWVRQSKANYLHLFLLWCECTYEYNRRYQRKHKSTELYDLFAKEPQNFAKAYWTTPPQCMPEKYKRNNYIDGYRAFYIGEKSRFAKWKNTKIPTWYRKGLKNECL